jgi:hypothetical protein
MCRPHFGRERVMFSVRDHGAVMGTLRTTPRGEIELMAIPQPSLTKSAVES